jgi:hypothetical protein
MGENDASRILIDDSRVALHIVLSLTVDSRVIIYNCNMFIVQATRNSFIRLAPKVGRCGSFFVLTLMMLSFQRTNSINIFYLSGSIHGSVS